MKTVQKVTSIKCVSRSKARQVLKESKNTGQQGTIVDKGAHLSGLDRWSVKVVRQVLVSPRKPSSDTIIKLPCQKLTQSRTDSLKMRSTSSQKQVFVYKKHSRQIVETKTC